MVVLEFENTVVIERPVEKVFTFAADPVNIPKWNYFVLDVEKTSEGELGVGSIFRQVRKTDEQILRVDAYAVNRRICLSTVPPSRPHLERDMMFESEAGSTKIIDTWKLEVLGLQRLASHRVRSAVAANLQVLKELLETGSVRLPDGRHVVILK